MEIFLDAHFLTLAFDLNMKETAGGKIIGLICTQSLCFQQCLICSTGVTIQIELHIN